MGFAVRLRRPDRADSTPQVVLITGVSSGIGRLCAEHLAARGYRVYGTTRRCPSPDAAYRTLRMDVTDDEAVARAVECVVQAESRIDVVVNNAGIGIAGAVEDTSADEARRQFETNVLGPLRVCAAVLPHMRRQGDGLIVHVSSIAALVPLPFQGIYSASKAALEAAAEAMRMEVRGFGVRVALLEPGDFRTGFTDNRVRAAAADRHEAYRDVCRRALAIAEQRERVSRAPLAVAHRLEHIIASRTPRFRHRVGSPLERAAPTLRHLLPQSLFERLLMRTYELRP